MVIVVAIDVVVVAVVGQTGTLECPTTTDYSASWPLPGLRVTSAILCTYTRMSNVAFQTLLFELPLSLLLLVVAVRLLLPLRLRLLSCVSLSLSFSIEQLKATTLSKLLRLVVVVVVVLQQLQRLFNNSSSSISFSAQT